MSAAVRVEAPGAEQSDRELVASVRRGDERAFELLYQRYHGRIVAYVIGMVRDHGRAEDLTQEIFFSALRRMRQTERPIAFRPWIYEIARNACIDQYRRSCRVEELSYNGADDGDDPRLISAGAEPEAAVDAKEQIDRLFSAFGGLSRNHHQILVLRELEGLSYREIGERMGLTRTAVESTLFRARRRLTEEYDELASGRRCQRVQSALTAAAAEGMRAAPDAQRVRRHLSYCQACRRHARAVGVETAPPARQGVAGRLAAVLPFPAFLRRPRGGAHGHGGSAGGAGQGLGAQWSSVLAPAAEPLATSGSKAAAALVALVVAGVGTGVANHGPLARPPHAADASAPLSAPSTPADRRPARPARRPAPGVASRPRTTVQGGRRRARSGTQSTTSRRGGSAPVTTTLSPRQAASAPLSEASAPELSTSADGPSAALPELSPPPPSVPATPPGEVQAPAAPAPPAPDPAATAAPNPPEAPAAPDLEQSESKADLPDLRPKSSRDRSRRVLGERD